LICINASVWGRGSSSRRNLESKKNVMKRFGLILWCLLSGALALSSTTVLAQENDAGKTTASTKSDPGHGYYVEFRAASIGAYGHSYAVYGSATGKPNYVDLHPMGNYALMAVGHVLPIPANTEWDPDVLKLPIASRYRKPLTGQQYAALIAAIRTAKANKSPYWNAVTNNCNHFIGQLAEAVGLRVPTSFQFSYMFVPALKALNEGERGGTRRAPHKPSSKPPAT
jgi:hypothetical protein